MQYGEDIYTVDVSFNTEYAALSPSIVTGSYDRARFTLLPSIENCVGVAVKSVNIPFTYYVFDATNNQFKISDAAHTGGSAVTITIEPGTYNSISLATQIQVQLISSALTNAADFLCFVDSTDSKFRIYDNNASSATFTLDFTISTSCNSALGFEATTYTSTSATFKDDSDADVTGKYNVKAPRTVNLTGPPTIYVGSNDLGAALSGKVRNQTSNTGLLLTLPVTSNYQGSIVYREENPARLKMSKTNISKLDLYLTLDTRTTYHDGTSTVDYLPLQGQSFQVTLRFFVADKTDTQVTDTRPAQGSFNPQQIFSVMSNKRRR